MADTNTNVDDQADNPEPAADHVHDYKIIRAKDGTPKPVNKNGHLANVRCTCGHELWRPGA